MAELQKVCDIFGRVTIRRACGAAIFRTRGLTVTSPRPPRFTSCHSAAAEGHCTCPIQVFSACGGENTGAARPVTTLQVISNRSRAHAHSRARDETRSSLSLPMARRSRAFMLFNHEPAPPAPCARAVPHTRRRPLTQAENQGSASLMDILYEKKANGHTRSIACVPRRAPRLNRSPVPWTALAFQDLVALLDSAPCLRHLHVAFFLTFVPFHWP